MISLKSVAFPREGEIRRLARGGRVHHAESRAGGLPASESQLADLLGSTCLERFHRRTSAILKTFTGMAGARCQRRPKTGSGPYLVIDIAPAWAVAGDL